MLGLLSITISTSPFHIIKHKHASLLCSPLNPVRPSNTVCRRTPSSQHTHRRNPVLPINAVFRRTPSSEHTHHRNNTVVAATPVVAATRRRSNIAFPRFVFTYWPTRGPFQGWRHYRVTLSLWPHSNTICWFHIWLIYPKISFFGIVWMDKVLRLEIVPSNCSNSMDTWMGFDLYLAILLLNCSHMLLVSAQFLGNVLNACRDHTLGSSRSSQLHALSDIAFTFCIHL
ncbi:uncharacterized protein G2W53_012406 [Senna tora]|uniref:Uncharacterized protein n=1 Tax=Senna tora TaxID=362788 RepID=A0A834WQL7_9FABA|nr:uncharacterized protein G2W53_012406 [Senna tora]